MESDPLIPYEWPGSYLIDEQEVEAVTSVIRARSPFRYYGHDLQHCVDRFEAAYRLRLGRGHALGVNSGTAALSIAMGMLDVGPGDEVLLPGYLWVSCISAVVRAGAIPRLVEIDDSFTMSPADLEMKLGPRSKAILLVHMSGAAGQLDQIVEIARRHGVPLVEDVAQANGASYRGRPLGSFGDVAIFSFQFNKAITAGEGGMVVCDDDELHRRAVALHDLGYARNEQGRLETDDPRLQLWGQGSRMSEMTAAMLLVQEQKLDSLVSRTRAVSQKLGRGLERLAGVQMRRVPDPDGDNGLFLIMTWPDPETCQRVVTATRAAGVNTGALGLNNLTMREWGLHLYDQNTSLVAKRGVNSRGYPWADPANAFALDYDYGKGALPLTDDLFARSSLLAVPPILSDQAIAEIVRLYDLCLNGRATA